MADNMYVDMDIDLTVDPEIARLEAEALEIQKRAEQAAVAESQTSHINIDIDQDEDKSRPIPTKINIRGLDHFTTQDIKQFAGEHYSTEELQHRIEWIDDTSANLVYNTEEAAADALKAFTDLAESIPEQLSGLQSRKAKNLSTHPDTDLQVRLAIGSDVKAPRAHERSRFYLMNPEHDPRERRRDYDNRPRRGAGGRRPERRRRDEPAQKFDVSMYDDDAGIDDEGEISHKGSEDGYSSRGQDRRPARRNNGEDLFAGKSAGRLRDRSASPIRDGDGRFGFDESQPRRREARRRSFTPPERRRNNKPAAPASKAGVELFPEKGSRSSGLDMPPTNGHAHSHSHSSSAVELFPAVSSSPKRNRELFPHKTSHSNHRRSDAFSAEEAAQARRTLADRISAPTNVLHDRPSNGQNNGFSIRGSATDSTPGFSIRGASKEVNPVVKELFPSKIGAASGAGGKDLFEDKMKGRNAQRRKAEDMF